MRNIFATFIDIIIGSYFISCDNNLIIDTFNNTNALMLIIPQYNTL